MENLKLRHPRPDFERAAWKNLNGEWDFTLFELSRDEEEKRFDRAGYTDKINVPFSWGAPLSGIKRDVPGTGWYRTEAEFDFDGRLFLVFGGADYECDVWVNGTHMAKHFGGYTPFECDVTSVWNKTGRNIIEARVRDENAKFQMYGKQGYGNILGIWQTVYLEARPEEYIESFRFVTKIDGTVEMSVNAAARDGAAVKAVFEGNEASSTVKDGKAVFTLKVKDPELWSPDSPRLYYGTLTLGGDTVSTYFGLREIGTAKFGGRSYKWITLNGKPIYINSTLDQAFNPDGFFTYPSDEAIEDEVCLLKRLNLNSVRIHIKCEEPYKLYMCDKLGVMVIADVPNFWSDPTPEAMSAYEAAWPEYFKRDFNHPCIYHWVMFNESWGLFTQVTPEKREYLPETQKWVVKQYLDAKAYDPTRIVEDNSPCARDHTITDINTWHFYLHGYETLRKHLINEDEKCFPGSTWNCAEGYTQTDAPLMNSECGMVWGIEASAGDSDIAYQYHFMLNEFRLHEKLCGFVFTEFHDVVNEFNGYYRIDSGEKDFGYQSFCRGMSISDLHAADFPAIDLPPCIKVSGGARVEVPVSVSSWTDAHHASGLTLEWELWHDTADGRITDKSGSAAVNGLDWGLNALKPIKLDMPEENAVAVLSLYLKDADGGIVSRNYTTFDVHAELPANITVIPLEDAVCEGFAPVWSAHKGEKSNFGGKGSVSFDVAVSGEVPSRMRIVFEAGAKRVLSKDAGGDIGSSQDGSFMLGYLVDRGSFASSYWQTDETRFMSSLTVKLDGTVIARKCLENDWADARGVLSWYNLPETTAPLDEAGSYGQLIALDLPARLIPGFYRKGGFTLTLEADNGLALYGRNSGRYATGMALITE